EADPVDVDNVDPEVLDQVDLAAGEHREAVPWIMAELLRPDIYRAVLVRPAAAGVLRGEDHDLVPMGLELPAGREDGGHDAVDRREGAVREQSDPHAINAPGRWTPGSCLHRRAFDSTSAPPPRPIRAVRSS